MSGTSSRALTTCPDMKGESDTHVERCVGLHVCKLQRCCQGMLCFEVGDGFDVLVQVHVASAKISVRPALPRPVAHLLCNHQVLRVVRDGLRIVPLRPIRVAEVPVRPALPRPVAHLLCNRQVLRVELEGLAEVPLRPRLPYAMTSPARSPTSFAIARCCVWYSMALLKSPSEAYALPRVQ